MLVVDRKHIVSGSAQIMVLDELVQLGSDTIIVLITSGVGIVFGTSSVSHGKEEREERRAGVEVAEEFDFDEARGVRANLGDEDRSFHFVGFGLCIVS